MKKCLDEPQSRWSRSDSDITFDCQHIGWLFVKTVQKSVSVFGVCVYIVELIVEWKFCNGPAMDLSSCRRKIYAPKPDWKPLGLRLTPIYNKRVPLCHRFLLNYPLNCYLMTELSTANAIPHPLSHCQNFQYSWIHSSEQASSGQARQSYQK